MGDDVTGDAGIRDATTVDGDLSAVAVDRPHAPSAAPPQAMATAAAIITTPVPNMARTMRHRLARDASGPNCGTSQRKPAAETVSSTATIATPNRIEPIEPGPDGPPNVATPTRRAPAIPPATSASTSVAERARLPPSAPTITRTRAATASLPGGSNDTSPASTAETTANAPTRSTTGRRPPGRLAVSAPVSVMWPPSSREPQ